MFKIREDHVVGLRQDLWSRFLDDAVIHFRTCLADETEELSDEELRLHMEASAEAAEKHGLVDGEDLIYFADVALLLGPEFDTDPAYQWSVNMYLNPDGMEKLLEIAFHFHEYHRMKDAE